MMANLFDNKASPEVAQFNELTMRLAQAAVDLTGLEEIDDATLAVVRQVRSTCSVLLSAINQVASVMPGGLMPPPPMSHM